MLRFLMMSALMLGACASSAPPEMPTKSVAGDVPVTLKVWVDARAGTGAPVHWLADGAVYAYPSGEKLFGMIGFDSSTVIWPDDPDEPVIHLTRKTFAYTDPVTGEVLKDYNGNTVEPIAYPYQVIRYRLQDGLIFADVEQGIEPRVQHIKAQDGIIARRMGESWAFTAPLFLNFPLPGGLQYEAWENYDFFVHPDGGGIEPHQMSWQRYGDLPPWAGSGKAIYHLLSWRVEGTDEFPPALLAWAKADKPQWLTPPANLDEVRALQSGEGGKGWGQ